MTRIPRTPRIPHRSAPRALAPRPTGPTTRRAALASALAAAPLLLALMVFLCAPVPASAQGTAGDYARAESLGDRLDGLAVDIIDELEWIGDTHRFWYQKSVEGGHRFFLVDAETVERTPAFDHERLAEVLGGLTGESYDAISLPFDEIEFVDEERAMEFDAEGDDFHCDLATYVCSVVEEEEGGGQGGGREGGGDDDDVLESPDGRYEALVRNYNVLIRAAESGNVIMHSTDGSEGDAYDFDSFEWSPDSEKLAAYRVRPGYERLVHYVESSPADQLQPVYSNRTYLKPGDVLEREQPVLFNVPQERQVVVDRTLFPNAYSQSGLEWWRDGRGFHFEYNQRGHGAYRIISVNGETGEARAIVNEEAETFFSYYTTLDRYYTEDGSEIVWASERDGWKHLYLYDARTGQVKNRITRGDWVVRDIDEVDEENRWIWFEASGVYPDQDPYFVHHFRVNLDGTGLISLTDADGTHELDWSEDREFYVDTWSRIDLPPVSVLRRTSDQAVVMELERGDVSALEAEGWRAPEPFVSKGRDGTTDIWGMIVRPTNFDPSRRYPVIEYIYAGPHDSHVPKDFDDVSSMMEQAELGFIVVQIDGMGTANRSKDFHDVAWKNLGDAGFPDRILWHEAAAEEYPWYDISRVGIYGTSAGGQNSLGALLFHPDFYHVAVSAAGCHDNRMDKISWNEQWMGWPVGPEYAEASNVDNAGHLQGKVLLVVGELDTNVPPASTMQVVDALIDAEKDFDLLVLPGAGHTPGGSYGERRRWDYFVEHLLDVDPPDRNAVPSPPQEGELEGREIPTEPAWPPHLEIPRAPGSGPGQRGAP